jgi:hypothetical protein
MRAGMYFRPGEGPAPRRPSFEQLVEQFPGPVAIARVPPVDTIALCGGEDSDGHPWALQVTYSGPGQDLLRVRTVRGTLDWTPVIRTVENLQTTMGTYSSVTGRPGAPEIPTSLTVDGVAVAGTRIDLPDRCGVRLPWQGQDVYCVGDPHVIEALELCTGTSADFARFEAFTEYIARRRTRG